MRPAAIAAATIALVTGCSSSDEPSARWLVITNRSLCLADAADARIHFRITVRNQDPTRDASAYVTPWRRYSDNSVNDSSQDALTLDVPAGETKTFRAEFGYNAEDHRLIECGVTYDGGDGPAKFEVVGY